MENEILKQLEKINELLEKQNKILNTLCKSNESIVLSNRYIWHDSMQLIGLLEDMLENSENLEWQIEKI